MIHPTSNGILLDVRVVPRASKPGIAGTRDGALLVRLSAAPVEGAANAELVEIIADLLDMPRRAVSIQAGEKSRTKKIRVTGIDVTTATTRLGRL